MKINYILMMMFVRGVKVFKCIKTCYGNASTSSSDRTWRWRAGRRARRKSKLQLTTALLEIYVYIMYPTCDTHSRCVYHVFERVYMAYALWPLWTVGVPIWQMNGICMQIARLERHSQTLECNMKSKIKNKTFKKIENKVKT